MAAGGAHRRRRHRGGARAALRRPIKITGAGRTDSGVHASGQVVSFSAGTRVSGSSVSRRRSTSLLPADCSVREAAEVEAAFSARFSARTRTYVYAILNRPQRDALLARYACHVARPLDVEAMRTAGNRLIGEHDFRAFSAAGPEDDPTATVRTVERLDHRAPRRAGSGRNRRQRVLASHGPHRRRDAARVRIGTAASRAAFGDARGGRPAVWRPDRSGPRPLFGRGPLRGRLRLVCRAVSLRR